jgi:hypothetical protein
MFGKKIVKRCPKGHEMDLGWRRCPRCTGRSGAAIEGRDITDETVMLGPQAAGADETRIVAPGAGRSLTGSQPSGSPVSSSRPPSAPPPGIAAPSRAPAAASAPPPPPPPPAPAPQSVRLECTHGPLAGQTLPLAVGIYKFGKAPKEAPDVKLVAIPADRFLSKDHALLTVGTASVVLSDPGSTNGTFVNGEKVTRTILKDGDELRIGETIFKLVMGR